jgi:nicotinamide mononucleotide adenylyltransferase
MNRGIERGVRYSFGNSIVDSVVRGIKNLDALYFNTINRSENKIQEEVDLEGRDSPAFFGEDDMPQAATEKQLNFAKKLIENCDEDEKEQYLEQISSPYFSKFQCSQLIQKLMPVK